MANKFKGILEGAGFYVTLSVCVLAAAVAGYYLLLDEESSPAEEPAQAEVAAPVEDLEITLPPVEESEEPAQVLEEVPAVSMPEELPVAETIPVVAEMPKLVVSPLKGEVVTVFSVDELLYSETMADWRTHDGVDIAAQAGTTVLAASAGTVLSVTNDALKGTTLTIAHEDGYQTTYANLQSQPTVAKGDSVTAGQIIGAVGTTAAAESAQGPHLHFSVTKDGDAVDPDTFLKQ